MAGLWLLPDLWNIFISCARVECLLYGTSVSWSDQPGTDTLMGRPVVVFQRDDCPGGCFNVVVKEGKKGFRECLFISICGIKAVFQIFRGKGCILQEALKTAFFPVFRQLVAVAGSGVISSVKAVDASFTKLIEEDSSGNTILCRRGSLDGA